jgi:hypothetical protein
MEAARERCCDELTEEGELPCGVPTSPPCGEEGLGDELGSGLMTGVMLDPCGQIVRSSALLAAVYLR